MLAEQLLAPIPGGTGRYTRELLAALAATAPPGWTVRSVTALHRDLRPAMVDGVRGPRPLPLPRRGLIAAWERGVPLWPGGDTVHAATPLAPPRPRKGRRLVVTVHDTVPFTHPETLTPRGAVWHQEAIRRAMWHADVVVVPTDAVAEELRTYAPGPARVHRAGHGVPEMLLREPDPEETARVVKALRLPESYVLAVGTIEPRKGLDVLVEAMAMPQAPDLPLVIVGPTGWGHVELGETRLLGRITDEELAVVLRRAAVLAMPSRAEGFGLPLLEAMAVGVPVVHSDAPALVEVAGGTGITVTRGDVGGLAEALRDAAGQPAPEAAMKRAREFSWTAAAESLWVVHSELVR